MDQFLDVNSAADKLGISKSRVHALIQSGRLPATKIGTRYIIQIKDLKLVQDRPNGRPPKTSAKKGKVDKSNI